MAVRGHSQEATQNQRNEWIGFGSGWVLGRGEELAGRRQ